MLASVGLKKWCFYFDAQCMCIHYLSACAAICLYLKLKQAALMPQQMHA